MNAAFIKFSDSNKNFDKEYFNIFSQDLEDLPIYYRFKTDSQKANIILKNEENNFGESLFSRTLINQIKANKEILAELSLILYKEFPLLNPELIYKLILMVRKYLLVLSNQDADYPNSPIIAFHQNEFIATDSQKSNIGFYPFYNFMKDEVILLNIRTK